MPKVQTGREKLASALKSKEPQDAETPSTQDEPTPAAEPVPEETPQETTPEPTEDTKGEPEETPKTKPKAKTTRKPKPKAKTAAAPEDSGFAALDDTREFVNLIYYGKAGSGKTTAAAMASVNGRVLIINAEGGLKANPLKRAGADTAQMVIWPQNGSQGLSYKGLQELYQQVEQELQQDPESWYAVVFDSMTEITAALLDRVQRGRVERTRNKGVIIDALDEWNTDRNDYGVVTKQLRDLMRKFRDLPCHTIITALERRDVDEDSGTVVYGPQMPPAVQADLMGYVDVVLHTRTAEEERPYRAVTHGVSKYHAKDRFGVFPKVVANPGFDRVVQYVEGTIDADSDPQKEDNVT